ncbi:MAG: DNA alkylation repair protein [Acidobacteria bacterium]|nr:DNA alkylation repair protein [Acidobacteriota bacterium]
MAAVLSWLSRRGRARDREGMARFGITSPQVFGVSMAAMRPLVTRLGRDHALAVALWETGWLEARLVAGHVAEPGRVTAALMDHWARGFDNWAVTDSTCLHLFCHAAPAWGRVAAWCRRRGEYQRRAAFALLAALAVHDRTSPDARFIAALPLLVAAAGDERPYVRKGVNWALRQIGKRNAALHAAAMACARNMLARDTPAARWIARDALRELTSAATRRRIAARRARVTRAAERRHT